MAAIRNLRSRVSVVDKFAEQVELKLKSEGISCAELAERTGLSRQYLYRILNKKQNPTLAVADKIAAALNLTIQITSTI